jgi:hypothetical protein
MTRKVSLRLQLILECCTDHAQKQHHKLSLHSYLIHNKPDQALSNAGLNRDGARTSETIAPIVTRHIDGVPEPLSAVRGWKRFAHAEKRRNSPGSHIDCRRSPVSVILKPLMAYRPAEIRGLDLVLPFLTDPNLI